LAIKLGGDPGDLSERARTALEERQDRLAAGDLLRMLTMLSELEPRFRRSTQQQLLLETMLVRFALIDRTVAIEDLLREISRGGPDTPDRGEPPRPPGAGRRGAAAGERERGEGRRTASAADTPGSVPRMFDGGSPDRRGTPPTASLGGAVAGAGVMMRDAVETDFGRGARTASASAVPVADINAIAGAWDDLVSDVRRDLPLVATLLEQAIPVGASATGLLTLQVDSPAVKDGLDARKTSIVAALARHVVGLERLAVKESHQAEAAADRMTVDQVRSGTLASLRRRDPVLAAAIDLLDLDLTD
jgi:DNA polymerase-3 subunit gamma/tau